jgi:hypothetical protein
MLGAVCANDGCSRRVRHPSGAGRPPLYCSFGCRRQAEYAQRRKLRTFEHYKEGFITLGESAVRGQLATDPDFAVQLIELAETYLNDPDGRERVFEDAEALELVFRKPRSFGVIGHDSPLPGSADIDYAEETGDWSAMAWTAYRGMTWQLASGFKPDLREWGIDD